MVFLLEVRGFNRFAVVYCSILKFASDIWVLWLYEKTTVEEDPFLYQMLCNRPENTYCKDWFLEGDDEFL